MDCMMAYGGNNILDLTLAKVYEKYSPKFSGSGTASGYNYSFSVNSAPVAKLVTGNAARNLQITVSNTKIVLQPVSGPGPALNKTLVFTANGKIAISNGVLSVTRLSVSMDNPNLVDALLLAVINAQVVPKIQKALETIKLPQLEKMFGTPLSAQVRTGQVISGPAFEAGIRITGKTGLDAADAPPATNISALNNGSATNALVIGMISADAVNVLIKAIIGNLSHSFEETGTKGPFGAGIKGTIKATTPVLSITNGSGRAKTTISINLKAGIKIPIKGWTWLNIPTPDFDVTVNNKLENKGNRGILELTGVGSMSASFDWPLLLEPVEAVVKGLINGVLNLFKGKISNAVAGKEFELFKLPSSVPGTPFPATLAFDNNGLSYSKTSVRALVRVKS